MLERERERDLIHIRSAYEVIDIGCCVLSLLFDVTVHLVITVGVNNEACQRERSSTL